MQVKHFLETYTLISDSQDIQALAYQEGNMNLLSYGCLLVKYDNDNIKAVWGCEHNIPHLSNTIEKII